MSNPYKVLSIFLFSMTLLISPADADCDEVLRQVGMNYSQQFSSSDLKSFAYDNLCKSNNRSSNTEVEAFYASIGLSISQGTAGVSNFCAENENFISNQTASKKIEHTVFSPAINAWESCKRVRNRGLEVRPNISTNGTLVSFYLRNLSSSDAMFLGAAVSPEGAATCNLAGEDGEESDVKLSTRQAIKRGGIAMMDCFLSPDDNNIIPSVAINIRSSIDNFQINIPELNLNPPPPPVKIVPERISLSLAGKPLKSQAYWGTNKARGTGWIDCPRSIYGIPDDFDIIVISTTTESWGRTGKPLACGHQAGFCDSAGEDCENIYISKGCAINREYHSYYKKLAEASKFSYSKEALCN